MTIQQIVEKYNLGKVGPFEDFIYASHYHWRNTMNGLTILDEEVSDAVQAYLEMTNPSAETLAKRKEALLAQQERDTAKKQAELNRYRDIDSQKKEWEFNAVIADSEARKINDLYEYSTAYINDRWDGTVNQSELQMVLTDYASRGWRLHSAFTNEAGKNSVVIGGFGLNSTMDTTILIFERRIKRAEQ